MTGRSWMWRGQGLHSLYIKLVWGNIWGQCWHNNVFVRIQRDQNISLSWFNFRSEKPNISPLLMLWDQDTKIWDFQQRVHSSQIIRVASWLAPISNLKRVKYHRRTGWSAINWATSMSFNPEAYLVSGSHLLYWMIESRGAVTTTIADGLHFKINQGKIHECCRGLHHFSYSKKYSKSQYIVKKHKEDQQPCIRRKTCSSADSAKPDWHWAHEKNLCCHY